MRARLAVSDARHCLLAVLSLPGLGVCPAARPSSFCLPDGEVCRQARLPFRPGRLACGEHTLYCADASEGMIYALDRDSLRTQSAFAAGPEIESLALCGEGKQLLALCGGADSVQALDARAGRLLGVAGGLRPCALALDARTDRAAVAGGASGEAMILDAATLSTRLRLAPGGAVCGVCFFAGVLMALCASGEYETGSVVGEVDASGRWKPWIALPGQPGTLATCDGGLLVGHLGWLSMLEAPNGRLRWQTRVHGLPTHILPLGRAAGFADGLDGLVGLVDLRRGTVLRRIRVEEPAGLACI